jgi:hypothetical protein
MKMRKGIQGPIGKGILFALFITLFGGLGFSRIIMRFFGGMEGVALVNKKEVSMSLYNNQVVQADQRISMIRQSYGPSADVMMKLQGISTDPQKNALNNVIHHELVNQVADKMNIHLAPEYLEERLGNPQFVFEKIGHLLPSYVFDQKHGINAHALMEFLKTPQMRGVEKNLEIELRRQFALLVLQSSFYVPNFMIKASYKEAQLAKRFSVQTFSFDSFLKKAETEGVSDQELKSFYDQENKATQRYWIPEKRVGEKWAFSAENYGITVTDSEVNKYYNDHKRLRYIETPAQFKVREIVFNEVKEKGITFLKEEAEKIHEIVKAAPDTFGAVAKETSQSETASAEGIVDFFKRGTKEKAYEKATIRLKADGDISPVTQLEDGSFVILQRVARKEATYKPLAQVRSAIIKSLTEQKFRLLFSKEADRAIKSKDKSILDKFIASHGGKKEQVGPLLRSDEPFGKRLFSLKKVGQAASFVLEGTATLLIYKEKINKKLPYLESIKKQVTADYYEKKATKALEERIKIARQKALEAEKLIPSEEAKISSTGFIKVDDEEKIKALTAKGYPLDFMGLDWEGAVISSLNKDGGVVIKLEEIEKVDEKLYKEEKQKLYKQVFNRIHKRFAASFIASLYRNATIKINDQLAQLKDKAL